MLIHNNEPLTANEVFWHLFISLMNEPSKVLSFVSTETLEHPAALAKIVFQSIEKRGDYPLYPYGDDYHLEMPEEFNDETKANLLPHLGTRLWLHRAEHERNILLDDLIRHAEELANSPIVIDPPIKSFMICGSLTIVLVRQGYAIEQCLNIQDDLVETGFLREDWMDFTEWDAIRVDVIRKALNEAIAAGYFDGGTSIKVY